MKFKIQIEHHLHIHGVGPLVHTLEAIAAHLEDHNGEIMTKIQEVLDKMAQVQVDVQANTDVIQSMLTFVDGQAALLADLKQQLADAIAAAQEAGADVVQLQAVLDSLDTAHTKLTADREKIAAALVANTTADPGTPA